MQHHVRWTAAIACALTLAACGDDDPTETDFDTGADAGADIGGNDTGGNDTGSDAGADAGGLTPIDDGAFAWEDLVCTEPADDYNPGADDAWAACISDDDTYHTIEPNVSSIARVGAFEEIADLLWRGGTPTPEDFVAARDLYATGEGLDSRVQRREDEHYPPATDGAGNVLQCRDEGVPAMAPERCVGPALILPILNEAFQAGIAGEQPEVNAARIEAALLWFFYVSAHKEATTCAAVAKDCDSAWAYYTGGHGRDGGIGLAGYFRDQVPEAHEEAYDGVLAVRCWRDLDAAETAEDLQLQAQAIDQLDGALLYGVARLVAERLADYSGNSGAAQQADWAFLQILGPVLDREAAARNPDAAASLADFWAGEAPATAEAVTAAIETLAEVFPCP